MAQRGGMLTVDVRNPLTGVVYPAGTPIPMTAFARQVLNDLPAPTNAATANNLQILQEFTNRRRQGGRQGGHPVQPALSAFGRVGWRDANIFDNPTDLGAVGRRRQRRDLRDQQAVLRRPHLHAGRHVAAGGAHRVVDAPGPARIPRPCSTGSRPPKRLRHHRAAERSPCGGGLPTQLITGYSDLGRQATNPQWQYPRCSIRRSTTRGSRAGTR